MIQLAKHNQSLRDLILNEDKKSLSQVVDLDSFDIVLRECLTIDQMREAGCFFTGQKLAEEAIKSLQAPILSDSVVLDPTCGAGNLLIECSKRLTVCKTLSATLSEWGKVLWGYDIHSSFIDAAKLRIIVEAIIRGAKRDCTLEDALELLPNIEVKDALSLNSDNLELVTHVIMNPPFAICPSPKVNYWKSGKVNSAGIFFDKYLRILPTGCSISVILPDVLRSGSRYTKFRDFVDSSLDGSCKIWGRFNSKTDVDVFILSGSMNKKDDLKVNWNPIRDNYLPLSSLYDVSVGSLVAYRDLEEGGEYAYFHAKNSIAWKIITEKTETRRFNGKVIKPPFVVVKRTSSPNGKFRASATIINLKEFVAVENHMIVIKPKSGNLNDCKKLIKILKSEKTNNYLNERIRLRHLTVSAIKEIPID